MLPPQSPKTVLYLTPSVRLLGARRSLLALATSLDPERWRPVVCGQSHGDLEAALQEHGIPFEAVKLGWWRKGKYFLWRPFAISRLAALIRRTGAHLVHCNEIYPNPYAIRACRQVEHETGEHIPVVTHMRLSVTPRMIVNYDLARADRIIVPSEGAGADFDVWPDKSDKVSVVYNGVDLAEFRRGRTRAEARRMLGLPAEGVLFVAVGQIGPRKGGDTILSAMARVVREAPGAHLVFVGNPHRGQEEFAEQLKRRAAEPDLSGRVTFHEFTQQILPYYEAMDVNLLISRDEGFGRTIIEAAALGAPSIGARVGGIPELIQDGSTGYLIEPEDDAALAEAMRRLAGDAALRESLGEAAFRHTAQHFSIASHTEKIMDLYDSLFAAV